jgi:hypothetical protein
MSVTSTSFPCWSEVSHSDLTVRLTPEELSLYREYGDYYIQKLGLDICHEPSKFRDRHVDAA